MPRVEKERPVIAISVVSDTSAGKVKHWTQLYEAVKIIAQGKLDDPSCVDIFVLVHFDNSGLTIAQPPGRQLKPVLSSSSSYGKVIFHTNL